MSSESGSVKELAAKAFEHFNNRTYEAVLSDLKQLTQIKGADAKAQHNLAITQYLLTNETEPKVLLDKLSEIRKKLDENADQKEENSDAGTSNSGSFHVESAETFFLLYNQAVILYQLKQYGSALNILERLFQNIEPVDEYLALKICFLLSDIYLTVKQRDKVTQVITYLEKTFPMLLRDTHSSSSSSANNNNNTSSNNNQSHGDSETSSSTTDSSSSTSPVVTSSLTSISPVMPSAEFRYYLHLCKARLQFLNGNVKASKKEIKLALGTNQNHNPEQNLMSTFLKANLEYLQNNFQKSIKLLSHCHHSSHQPHAGNSATSQELEKQIGILYYNNLGCLHYRMKKYNMALFYFSKALQAQGELEKQSNVLRLPTFSKDHKMEILYNTGHQLLLIGNTEGAFQCFQESLSLFHKQPKVWLKLAECCVSRHVMQFRERRQNQWSHVVRKTAGSGKTTRIVLPDTADFVHRSEPRAKEENSNEKSEESPKQEGSVGLTLEYGAKCVNNALNLILQAQKAAQEAQLAAITAQIQQQQLLQQQQSADGTTTSENSSNHSNAVPSSLGSSSGSVPGTQTPPIMLNSSTSSGISNSSLSEGGDNNMNHGDLIRLKEASLVLSAYIHLSLNDPLLALTHSRELLAIPGISENQRILGSIYAAEALCLLDKPQEAAELMNPVQLGLNIESASSSGLNLHNQWIAVSPYSHYSTITPAPAHSGQTHGQLRLNPAYALYVNLAVVHILKGDLVQAQACNTKALAIFPSAKAVLTQVYLDLRRGDVNSALYHLKHVSGD